MKKYQQGLLLLALLPGLGLTSCSDDNPWSGSDQEGGIALNLESDGRLMRHTRADDTKCPIVPDANAFGIKLTKSDKTFSKSWDSLDGFNKESNFTIGDYTIEATYGDVAVQGFENPCFKGSNEVHVSPGVVTPVNITATLANAMVTLRYTDQFVAQFPKYSAAVKTPGHDNLIIAQDETRPAFIDPSGAGNTELNLTLFNAEGKQVTVNPATFTVKPRCNYVVTVNVTGNINKGDLVLDIQFEEEVAHETFTISLGDDLFNAPAPQVKATNFTVGTPVSLMEYDELEASPQFDIFAFGGFRSVNLEVLGANAPAALTNVQLVGADELTQQQLAEAGVKVSGLFKNSDKMAVVNVRDMLGKLAAGSYTVRVSAVDQAGRVFPQDESGQVALTAEVAKTEYTIASAGNIDYMKNELSVVVNTNAEQMKDRVKFRVGNADATVKSVTAGAAPAPKRTRADLPYTYTYVLEVPQATAEEVNVESSYGRLKAMVSVKVNGPEYTVDVDPFARFSVIRINTENQEMKEYLTQNLDVYNGNSVVTPGNIVRDAANGLITIKGLTAAKAFDTYRLKIAGSFEKAVPAFTTESELAVPNGDFSSDGKRFQFSDIQVGGTYRVGLIDYTVKSSIDRTEPLGWSTVNDLTCYSGSSNKNSWFMVPSTFMNNGVVVVRSVGYNHNGTTPAKTGSFGSTTYYCTNTPTDSQLEKAAGELYLGTYSYNGTATRSNGVDFGSRPAGVSFDYKYVPYGNDVAQFEVKVLDVEGKVLVSKIQDLSIQNGDNLKNVSFKIDSYPFGKKAAKIYICFRSSKAETPSVNIPSGSALNEGTGLTINAQLSPNSYKTFAKGSELTVDNVKVSYDGVPTITK